MKLFHKVVLLLICLCSLSACNNNNSSATKIGMILPIEHRAMDEIVAGFSETLKTLYSKPVTIKVMNAQGDANLQRAIIQQMRDENYAMIVPIGTGASQMTLAMTTDQPVISLAAELTEADRNKRPPCHVAIVHDEISPTQLIDFIHSVYPKMTQMTLIHSSSDKVMPELDEAIAAGKKNGITVNHLMVSTLPDLVSSAASVPAKTQAIFVLKDNLIVSGIGTLAKLAADRHIPLITADQGSVQEGAGFALGVHEKEIGVEGAKLAASVLQGKLICQLPIAEMQKLTVFVNEVALQQEKQQPEQIINAANKANYAVELTKKSDQ